MTYRQLLFANYTSNSLASIFSIEQDAYILRERAFHHRFSKILPKEKSAKILDIGCGMGFFLWYLQKNGYTNTYGIDISPEQVEIAKKYGVNGVSLSDWNDFLATNESQFDFILLDNVIEHLNKDEVCQILQAILFALKPGGKLYISTPNSGSLFGSPLAFIDFTHEVYFTGTSLLQILNSLGFNSAKTFGEPLLAFDFRSSVRKIMFNLIKPVFKSLYLVGTGGAGRNSIEHIIEPSLGAIAYRSIQSSNIES